MPSKEGKIRILAIDGGGVRGLLALEILIAMEREAGKPIAEMFDMIVGTSTGGIIALGLGRHAPYTARSIKDIYLLYLPQIFKRDAWRKIKSLGQLAGPKYDNKELRNCVNAVIGDKPMSYTGCHLMVPTYNITTRTPVFISSYASPGFNMADAAMCTSAAPTYFSPWPVSTPSGTEYYVDGGTCDNNPALSAVIEACRLYDCTVRDCIVMSVGTGSDMQRIDGKKAAGWGLLNWAEPLVSIFTDGVSELHGYHLARLLPDEHVLRLQTSVSGELSAMDNVDPSNLRHLATAGNDMMIQNQQNLTRWVQMLQGA